MFTVQKAISEAIRVFIKTKIGKLSAVKLLEGSGDGNKWEDVSIRIEYSIDGDYTQSDNEWFVVNVYRGEDGKVKAERVTDIW